MKQRRRKYKTKEVRNLKNLLLKKTKMFCNQMN